jgi:hypothetical protein
MTGGWTLTADKVINGDGLGRVMTVESNFENPVRYGESYVVRFRRGRGSRACEMQPVCLK